MQETGQLQVNKQWVICHCNQGSTWYSVNLPIAYTSFYNYVGGEVTASSETGASTTTTMNQALSTLSTIVVGLKNSNANWSMTVFTIGKQQWGVFQHIQGDIWYTINFPISFESAVYNVVCSPANYNYDSSAQTPATWKKSETTISQFVCGSYGTSSAWGASWIAYGKQQWGYVSCNYASNTQTDYFPIAFTTRCDAILLTATRNGTYAGLYDRFPSIISNTLTSFLWGMYEQNGPGYATYIAIGKQQWGYVTSATGGETLTFPIAFSNSSYAIVGSAFDSSLIYCAKFTNKNVANCIMYNGIGHVSYNGTSTLDWIAIGY